MSYPKDEIAAPPSVRDDDKSFELARLWIADGSPRVALRVGVWDDPAAWGVLLADVARHIAVAYSQSGGHDAADALERVLIGFRAEFESTPDA